MTNYHELLYDADYERARDAFIPKAVVKANRDYGKTCKLKDEKSLERYARNWSKCFHTAMNRLALEAGLLK